MIENLKFDLDPKGIYVCYKLPPMFFIMLGGEPKPVGYIAFLAVGRN